MKRTLRNALFALLVATAPSLASAQDTATLVEGADATLFGAQINSWAKLDADGQVVEAGITLPMAVLEDAPAEHHRDTPSADVRIDFPAVVQDTTFLDHAGFFWEAQGHFPDQRYGVPHWDFHFFSLSGSDADAIDCSDLSQVAPEEVAPGWFPPVPPGAPAIDFCVPAMGFHSLPASEFQANGELRAQAFDMVMIGGYYAGSFVFVEPMVTQAAMLRRESFGLPVPVPASTEGGTYPTTFEAIYDPSVDAYHLVFRDFANVD
ncbi:MAG: DUF5602 domain-containing protein [Trueperaceae bacterium]